MTTLEEALAMKLPLTLDEAKALKKGDLVRDNVDCLWRVDNPLHEAGNMWGTHDIHYLMRLVEVRSETPARARVWLVSEHELEALTRNTTTA